MILRNVESATENNDPVHWARADFGSGRVDAHTVRIVPSWRDRLGARRHPRPYKPYGLVFSVCVGVSVFFAMLLVGLKTL